MHGLNVMEMTNAWRVTCVRCSSIGKTHFRKAVANLYSMCSQESNLYTRLPVDTVSW